MKKALEKLAEEGERAQAESRGRRRRRRFARRPESLSDNELEAARAAARRVKCAAAEENGRREEKDKERDLSWEGRDGESESKRDVLRRAS